jgi:hypothetical protein
MGKFFNDFANSGPGSWLINVIAVMAGIILAKLLVIKFPDSGFGGAVKAGVNFV